MNWLDKALEKGYCPEWLIRVGIRYLLREKLQNEAKSSWSQERQAILDFVEELKQSPIAVETDTANVQHYEVPSRFYALVLGPRRKYSSGYWDATCSTLAASEEAMLQLSCERADIQDGQRVLDLGCGWGSMSLWLAAHYPNAKITGLSNSKTQKAWIDEQARQKGYHNLEIVTANIVTHQWARQFDRIISIEMFEHMKNYELLLEKLSHWLPPQGKLFVHIFTHRRYAYHYLDNGPKDWLTRYFFAGGTMPSDDLLLYFQRDLTLTNHWALSGIHYQKTAEAWLQNMKQHETEIRALFAETYGSTEVQKWWVYWQVFFMACAELWGYAHGEQWGVSHYCFEKQDKLAEEKG